MPQGPVYGFAHNDRWGCQKPEKEGISRGFSFDGTITLGEAGLIATGFLSAMMLTFATIHGNRRASKTYNPPVKRFDDPWAQMFDTMVSELSAVGGADPTRGDKPMNLGIQEVDYNNRYGKWISDEYTVTVNNTEASVKFPQSQTEVEQPSDSDRLTGFKIIWANSKVDGCYYTRHYEKKETDEWARKISQQYLDAVGTGRSSCTCLRDRSDKGFAASITFEGESNDNGKFDHIRCD